VPWDWRPRALLHESLLIDNQLAEAENRMREALRVQPDNTQYLRMMAQVLDMEGKKEEAKGIVRTMMESGRDLWDTYYAAAREYAGTGAFDSAIMVLQEYADAHPGDRRAAAAIGQLERAKGQGSVSGRPVPPR
jgi:predicted Zn-dependent protease